MGLRAEDRRVRAVLIPELCVDSNAVQLHVAVVVRSTRVTTRGSHVHVTGDQALTNTLGISQVSGLSDAAAGDHVSVDDRVLIRHLRSRSQLRRILRKRRRNSRRVHDRLHRRRDQRQGESRSRDRRAAAAGDVLEVHVFLPETVNKLKYGVLASVR